MLRSVRTLGLGLGLAVVLLLGAFTQQPSQAAAQQQVGQLRQGPHRVITKKLFRAYRKQRIDVIALLALVRAQREQDKEILDALRAFQEDRLEVGELMALVKEKSKIESQEVHVMDGKSQEYCEMAAFYYFVGCFNNGGTDCYARSDAFYCGCIGGYDMGGGFCYAY